MPLLPSATAAPIRLPGPVPVVLVALLVLLGPAAAGVPGGPVPVGVWPLVPAPVVVAGFDPPDDPWGSGHRGVDLAGGVGQPVRTAMAGHVAFAGRIAGRGVVVVDHGDTRTTYEPVTATVRLGAAVARGQPIGTLELAGSHCFPRACLHWGWLRGTVYLDPLTLVGAGPVRLLPLWRESPGRAGLGSAGPAGPYAALLSLWLRPWGGPAGRPAAGGPW